MNERVHSIDFIKVICSISIICLHARLFSNTHIGSFDGTQIYIIIDTLCRFAVPFFFISAGFLFGNKINDKNKANGYAKKYVIKILKMYFAWVLITFLYNIVLSAVKCYLEGTDVKQKILTFIQNHINPSELFYYGTTYSVGYHLWFLIALVWSIIILMIFRKFNKIKLLLVISGLLHIVGQFGQTYSGFFNIEIATRDTIFFGLFYVTIGYFISEQTIPLKLKLRSNLLLILFFVFNIVALIERFVILGAGTFNSENGNYYMSTVFVAVTLFLYALSKKNLGKDSVFNKLSVHIDRIYVIHVPVMVTYASVFTALGVTAFIDTVLWQLIFVPIIFITSLIISYLLDMLLRIITHKRKRII